MEISGSRILLAGATGVIGGKLAEALSENGARLFLAGRDPGALASIGERLQSETVVLDYSEPESVAGAVEAAIAGLGGLDVVVVATGAVAFGEARDLDPEVLTRLIEANATGPMHLISESLKRLEPGGSIVAITAVVAEFPTAGMAAYSASKASLAAFLSALRREVRRQFTVLEVSPGHMETGFAGRALAGEPPAMPEPEDVDELVGVIVQSMIDGRREIRYDIRSRELQVK
jgi:NAD(P)-dependent dehydrogenase (short-subunit alcohol dehydrogenase family)